VALVFETEKDVLGLMIALNFVPQGIVYGLAVYIYFLRKYNIFGKNISF